MKIIPAIDLRQGRVVRLKQGDFDAQRAFDLDPVALTRRYRQAGAEWLHLVDLDGARNGAPAQLDLIARIAAEDLHVQAGGGVRTRADLEHLFAAGVARVVVGSVAVRSPERFAEWLGEFGAERLCLALDLRRDQDQRWRPAVDAWQGDSEADFAALLDRYAAAGLRHVLCTDIGRDGMGEGPNRVLYSELAAAWPQFDWIASGGVRDRADVVALAETGVAACVAGTALLDGTLTLEEVSACSHAA